MSSLQGFNIVLLVGESQSSGASIEDVPPAARKALADMKDFLPFKHYRVLDSQWTSCCSNSRGSSDSGTAAGSHGGTGRQSRCGWCRARIAFSCTRQADSRLSVQFHVDARRCPIGRAIADQLAARSELEKRPHETPPGARHARRRDRRARHGKAERKASRCAGLQAQQRRVQQRIAETTNRVAARPRQAPKSIARTAR